MDDYDDDTNKDKEADDDGDGEFLSKVSSVAVMISNCFDHITYKMMLHERGVLK